MDKRAGAVRRFITDKRALGVITGDWSVNRVAENALIPLLSYSSPALRNADFNEDAQSHKRVLSQMQEAHFSRGRESEVSSSVRTQVGTEAIQESDIGIRRVPEAQVRGPAEADGEGRTPIQMQGVQEGPSEDLLQGQDIRAAGGLSR